MKSCLSILLLLLFPSFAAADLPALILPEDVSVYLPYAFPGKTHKTPVRLNHAAIFSAVPGDKVQLTLPNGNTYSLTHERSEHHRGGNRTWIGHISGLGNDYRVIITYGPHGSYGLIQTPEREYKIEPFLGVDWVVDHAAEGLQATPFDNDTKIPMQRMQSPILQRPAQLKATPSPQTTIDLMIVYTPGLANKLGGGLQTRLDHLVAVANQAYIDSEVAITLRLVHSAQVNYVDTTSNDVAIDDLTFGTHPGLAGVAALRDTHAADLVTLIRPYSSSLHIGCGVGWVGGYNGQAISQDSEYGYSVVSDGSDGSYYCDDISLTHELAHNMGSMHDRTNVPAGEFGAYSYSFGYGVTGVFGTVMAYISPRVYKFSNPNLSCSGVPCGVSESAPNSANNALSLNNTRVAVSGFRTPGPPGILQLASASYTVNENGGSVIVSVTRSGGSFGAASVSYSSANGSALAGSDYTSVSGNLSWASGETGIKTFSVPIVDDNVMEPNESFTVSISAASGASLGSPATANITITDNDGNVPTSLTATALSSSQISLAWNGTTPNYELERCSGSPAICTYFSLSSTSFVDNGLSAQTAYTYRVRGRDAGGNYSAYSASAKAMTPAAPINPPPSISLAVSGGTTAPANISLNATASDDGGIARVEFFLGNSQIGIDTSVPYNLAQTGLTPGSYTYTARAMDNLGAMTNSNSVTVTITPGSDTTAPTAPSGLSASALSATQVNISWNTVTDNLPGPVYYELERCTTTNPALCTVFFLGHTSFTDRMLSSATRYRYRVRAGDQVGNRGDWTNSVEVVTN